ncbi:MAG TPA: MBL fold metallo-hydrolase [Symbiobacteriaceae bacterium]|jgi:glyoxylase-like metal-dependent hydrolase (beta-lactamase superfamily II)
MTVQIYSRELGDFATNCYIVACPQTNACAVIDPGVPDPWVKRTLADHGLKPVAIILTHGHLDHIGGVAWVREFTGAPVLVHTADAPMLTDPVRNGSAAFGGLVTAPPPDRLLADGETITVGKLELQVLHTPGHTPGGICLYIRDGGHLITGDTLFAGSIGRTDLPGGSFETLIRSIREKLLTLPDETTVYPGHGPATSIGDERAYNPFL